ncbi:MAG: Holliday junction resolvase RuvX [Clostridiales bacterium]|nr:Holliday junction resolvase RuvX [Clostridiales bacterium]
MKILAVDLGEARTGLAVCDPGEMLASPAGMIMEKDEERLLTKIAEEAKKLRAELIVVGHPVNMDGSRGERAQKCAHMAGLIEDQTGIPTKLWDERCTTMSAIGYLNATDTRGKKRKQAVDQLAATIILESYLDYRKAQQKRKLQEGDVD